MGKKAAPKKRGRESKYVQLGISQKLKSIEGWARHGSTLDEIAQMLGVSVATIHRWKGKYCEFREAIRAGAPEANGEILNSAFRQSVGYYALQRDVIKLKKVAYEEVDGKAVILRDARGTVVLEDVEKVVEYMKYYEADARMTIYMLSNRLREDYQVKVSSDGQGGLIVQHCIPDGGDNENS